MRRNLKSEIRNPEHGLPYHLFPFVSKCMLGICHETRDEFITLGNGSWHLAALSEAFTRYDLEQDHGFALLFQCDLHHVDEVLAGFRALCLAKIRRGRGAGPDQLVCDVDASLGVRQSLDNTDDGDSIINQSFFEYLRCHDTPNQRSAIINRR